MAQIKIYGERGQIECPAFPVAQVADTIGAGDTFHSAFLACLSRSENLRNELAAAPNDTLVEAVEFACGEDDVYGAHDSSLPREPA